MNNDQFRRLVLGASTASGTNNGAAVSADAGGVLGSRNKARIPMTPRSGSRVSRQAFAQQMAARALATKTTKTATTRTTRTSAPKGSRLAGGYVDRAKLRAEMGDGDDNAAEGGRPAHGLDLDAVARARRGDEPDADDGTDEAVAPPDDEVTEAIVPTDTDEPVADVDDELGQLEGSTVAAVVREKTKKRGQWATTGQLATVPGQKRTRDQILAELRAARAQKTAQTMAQATPSLGSRFKPITATAADPGPSARIERDSKGRDVLVFVDEHGHERRKVRKRNADADVHATTGTVLGMEVPEVYRAKQKAEAAAAAAKEDTIFDDVDSDYDPLAGLEDEDDEEAETETVKTSETTAKTDRASDSRPRYFDSELLSETTARPALDDPHMLAVLRKAQQMRQETEAKEQSAEKAREDRLQTLLRRNDRDAEDLDLGFGTSRLEDEDERDGGDSVRLSTWGDDGEGEGAGAGGGSRGGRGKRKRGPKKRKGDGNQAEDVLRVLEKQRAE